MNPPGRAASPPFRLLFVCTGNQCRSPMAEWLARAGIAARLGATDRVVAESAGTRPWPGAPMTAEAVAVLRERGIEAVPTLARRITVPLVDDADLVLTATREHRAAVLAEAPGGLRRTFTLRGFARLAAELPAAAAEPLGAGGDPADHARSAVAAAFDRRREGWSSGGAADDIADPIGRPIEVYRATAGELSAAVTAALDTLFGPPRPTPPA